MTTTASSASAQAAVRRSHAASRPAEYVARQTPFLRSEMKRVAWVGGVCFSLLVVLTLVDRFQ